MSILSTVKKGYLYMKTSSGYLKLLPRTLASLVSLDNGKSVETEISSIKSEASNLSSTVSGHTTTLNSHGSSISAIKTKTDALKNAANKTVANNLTTTVDGYVLDARMGKSLQDSITTLNSTSVIELGKNNNGYYKKYSNGTLEMWGVDSRTSLSIPSQNVINGIYYTNQIGVNLPITSLTECSIQVNVLSNSIQWVMLGTGYSNKTSFAYRIAQPTGSNPTVKVCWFAIGTWK